MTQSGRLMNFWPGASVVITRGSVVGLFVALLFGLMLNLALAGTFVWPEIMSPWAVNCLIATVIISSVISYFVSERLAETDCSEKVADQIDQGYRRATEHYLRGEWFETEVELREILDLNPRDLETRLFLATLYRHGDRLEEAENQIRTLLRLENSWTLEPDIRRQWHFIQQQLQKKNDEAREEVRDEASSELSVKPAEEELPVEETPAEETLAGVPPVDVADAPREAEHFETVSLHGKMVPDDHHHAEPDAGSDAGNEQNADEVSIFGAKHIEPCEEVEDTGKGTIVQHDPSGLSTQMRDDPLAKPEPLRASALLQEGQSAEAEDARPEDTEHETRADAA